LGFAAAAERGEMGLTDANSCAAPVRVTRTRAETGRECVHGYVCVRLDRARHEAQKEKPGHHYGREKSGLGQCQPTATRSRDGRETEIPGGGQSTGEAAERDVCVPACEQGIHGSLDKHKGVVLAARICVRS
jgi:hypothetical protein